MENYIGELAAIGTSLCYAFGSTFFTFATRDLGVQRINRLRLVIALLFVVGMHALLVGRWLPAELPPAQLTLLVASGIIGLVIGDACLFQAFVMIGPRLSMLMMALAPVFATIMARIFLPEEAALPLIKLAGIVLAVAGIALVVTERRGDAESGAQHVTGRQYWIGLLFGIVASLGQAAGSVLAKSVMDTGFEPISALLIRLAAATVLIWVLAVGQRQVMNTLRGLRMKGITAVQLLTGVMTGPVIGVWLTLIALQRTSTGVASTLTSLAPIFLIPVSAIVFKERVTWQAVMGTLVAFGGTVLLFVG
jgi:drug/metabolite transporter (DMT)-like permease